MSEHPRDRLAEFLVGALDEAETESVALHVSSCARCGEELALLHSLEGSLGGLRPARRPSFFFAVAALAAAVVLAFLLLRPQPPVSEAPVSREGPLVLACGSRVDALPLARVETPAPRAVVLRSGTARFDVVPGETPFQVRTPRGTVVVLGTKFVVEVEEDMNAKVPTAAAVVTITVVSGMILWKSNDGLPETRVKAGEQAVARAGAIELKAAPPAALADDKADKLAKENESLRAKLAEVTRRNAELENRVAAIGSDTRASTPASGSNPSTPAAARETAPPPVAEKPALRIRFGPAKHQDALAKVKNWAELAEACRNLGPILKEYFELTAKGEKVPNELLQKVVGENNKLVGLAMAVNGQFATHTPGNGEYTHPLVLGNLMSKHLELASLPLDDRQVDEIARIGGEFDERYVAMQASYGEQTFKLEKILDELELKRVYVERIVAIFGPEQRAALIDPAVKDLYAVDLYSPLLMLMQRVSPIGKPSVEELKKSVAKAWTRDWELGDKSVDAIAEAFVRECAPVAVPPAAVGAFRIDDAIRAGRATIKAMKEALRTLALDEDTAKEIRTAGGFVVPRLTTGDAPK